MLGWKERNQKNVMEWDSFFARLLGVLASADASSELMDQVQALAGAPIWDDERACETIAQWSQSLMEWRLAGVPAQSLNAVRVGALAELRGEKRARNGSNRASNTVAHGENNSLR